MLHPDEALQIVTSAVPCLAAETVGLPAARGRVLAGDMHCRIDQPPFSKSKMDGYAFRAPPADGQNAVSKNGYRLTGTAAAGDPAARTLQAGECVRIMTGAPIPLETTGVQRVELARESAGCVFFTAPDDGSNLILRGQHARAGDRLMGPRILSAADIGVLAADGCSRVDVVRRPNVAILSTGTELTEPGPPLEPGRIYDSNRFQLRALCEEASCEVRDGGIIPDRLDAVAAAVSRELETADVLLLSGGVSMGDFDYVPEACSACGVEKLFHKVAIKPGRPVFFGRRESRFVFGLPGNPLSACVIFDFLVRPLLLALCGLASAPATVRCRLSAPLHRETTDRVEFLPVALDGINCTPLRCDGSSMITVLARTAAFARLDIGRPAPEKGDWIDVRPVR